MHNYSNFIHQMTVRDLFHDPVLKKEVLEILIDEKVKTVFDGTLGLGGHAFAILEKFPKVQKYIACDLDLQHFEFAKNRLKPWAQKLNLVNKNFSEIQNIIEAEDAMERPLAVLLDLGLCSNQIDDKNKGFSFRHEGDLNMSFGADPEVCKNIVNESEIQVLTDIMRNYGEEKRAYGIAKQIIATRADKKIETTTDLKEIIEASVPMKDQKKALMRVFQAFRMATNKELEHLEKALEGALAIMQSGDRLGVMSYHSLEDRMVKKYFNKISKPETEATNLSLHTVVCPAIVKLINKKPIVSSPEELVRNPRSRSVKFRIIEKI